MKQAIGKITPVKAYQTTDGKKFIGETAKQEAESHQRVLNTVDRLKEKSRIPEDLKLYPTRSSYGLLEAKIYYIQNKVVLTYGGNMGSSIKNVEECLEKLFFGCTLKRLKQLAKKVEESGSPDYWWKATFHF